MPRGPAVWLAVLLITARAGADRVSHKRTAAGTRAPPALAGQTHPSNPRLLPYPQDLRTGRGRRRLGPVQCVPKRILTPTQRVALDSLGRYLPKTGKPLPVRLGSVEEGYDGAWLTGHQRSFLQADGTSPEACVVTVKPQGVTVVGKGKWGMLYGVQTVNQLAIQAAREHRDSLPCLTVRDWPDLRWRCLAPTLTWYSGWNRLEGYDLCNWSKDEWKWLVDWSVLHKCNAWAVCMYGYWPFSLPGYEETTLQVDSFFFDPKTGRKTPWRFVHPNIKREFLPEVIRYANERGIAVHAYIGKNSFNGGYLLRYPDANAGGAAEMLPFHPAFDSYIDAFIGRILDLGFNGFVFEDPESYHVPNQNDRCYETFWKPWADTYGFHARNETDENKPPLGVHVEYYTWLFRHFDASIQRHARRLGRNPEIHLISHFLLSRILAESKSKAEQKRWLDLLDEKQGRKVHYVVAESNEKEYVELLGGDRVASLGGRGGSCTCAMRRIASVNNNWLPGPMGTSVDWERDCQRRLYDAGGTGAMGYIFEWRLNEVFGYIAAQYLWRNAGVPGLNNEDQYGFLDYASRRHFGERAGSLVARALDGGANVNEAMVLDGVYGSQYPETGRPLYRDYQLLAAQADVAVQLAGKAYRAFTGEQPNLEAPLYRSASFRWNGYEPNADHLFRAESLRRLCVSTRRSQRMCEAALAYRKAMRLTAEGSLLRPIFEQLGRAVEAAEENQRLYQMNYDDDYDWTDGLCARLTERLKQTRDFFLLQASGGGEIVRAWTFDSPRAAQEWGSVYDLTAPVVSNGALLTEVTGRDPQIVHAAPLSIPIGPRDFVEIEMASNRSGRAELFWTDREADGGTDWNPTDFRQHPPVGFAVDAGESPTLYHLTPPWKGVLTGLRLDLPDEARVRLRSITIRKLPEGDLRTHLDMGKSAPDGLRRSADKPLFIPWEKQTDLLPAKHKALPPGFYLSLNLGLNGNLDASCQGVVFTVQRRHVDGEWRTVFRRSLGKNSRAWERWEVPIPDLRPLMSQGGGALFRFLTDSYSRAQDRGLPSWRWALWGQPQLFEVAENGKRRVVYDFIEHLPDARPFVRLDSDGKDRPFDSAKTEASRPTRSVPRSNAGWQDSTGATFQTVGGGPLDALRQGEGRNWQWVEGFASPGLGERVHHSAYLCYLGVVPSWWGYADEGGEVEWTTAPVPNQRETAVVFIGGTDYVPGKAELLCNNRHLISFETGSSSDTHWQEKGVELRYLHGGDTRDERIPYGLSGVFVLRLPPDKVAPGKPLHLVVRMLSGGHAWFMLHGFKSALNASRLAVPPKPSLPCIAAFTPHRGDVSGLTGADYEVRL